MYVHYMYTLHMTHLRGLRLTGSMGYHNAVQSDSGCQSHCILVAAAESLTFNCVDLQLIIACCDNRKSKFNIKLML